ncbi:MAG: ATP-binding protein [bacterium]
MFRRYLEASLNEWKNGTHRKPLIIRGARQTGKTTLVHQFAGQFNSFIELNLEKDALRRIFTEVSDIRDVVRSIEGVTNQRIVPGETLLFIDEIQNSVSAIKLLRYFYEEMPGLHVIAAGSLLEVRMKDEGWSFPVGRVEFQYLYPVTFGEFLEALGEEILLEAMRSRRIDKSIPGPLHEKLLGLTALYMTVGGMPEAVSRYVETGSIKEVRIVHDELHSSFHDDFAKYSKRSEVEYLKLVWDRVPFQIGARIKYSRLSEGQTRSRDISNAFSILHEAMLVERVWPTTRTSAPLVKKPKAAPKALYLDIGLCTHVLKLTEDQIRKRLMDPAFGGGLAEAFVGQELLAKDAHHRVTPYFWIREEKDTTSELDFLLQRGERLIPVEVKAGSHGTLKSLHQYLYRSGTNFGVRVYEGKPNLEHHNVILPDGSSLKYKLLSIPLYSVSCLEQFDVMEK